MKKLFLSITLFLVSGAGTSLGANLALSLPGNADSFFEVPDAHTGLPLQIIKMMNFDCRGNPCGCPFFF